MPELSNTKIERFCQLRARGFNQTDAHELSSHPRNTGNATTMGQREDVIARIVEIKEQRGIEAEKKREADDTTSDDIDEDWLLDEYRMLLQESRDAGDLKVAKSILDEIGAMRTLGDFHAKQNLTKGIDSTDRRKQLEAPPPAIDITVLAQALKVLDEPEIVKEPIDITPEEETE